MIRLSRAKSLNLLLIWLFTHYVRVEFRLVIHYVPVEFPAPTVTTMLVRTYAPALPAGRTRCFAESLLH